MDNPINQQNSSPIPTSNPLAPGVPESGALADDFQQSATSDILNQTKTTELSVERTGPPVETPAPVATSTPPYWLIIVGTIAFLFLVKKLYAWVMSAPVNEAETPAPTAANQTAVKKPVTPAKKKKQPRSKRHK